MGVLALSRAPGDAPRALPVGQIQSGPFHLRRHLAPETLETLAATIRRHGVLQPIVVRPVARDQYQIIAGERRWQAARQAGLETIPATIRRLSDRDALAVALIENIQHEALNPLEEAQALARLIRDFQLTHQEAADAVGRSRSAVSNLLRLLDLAPAAQALLAESRIDMGHARALLPLPAADQERLAALIAARGLSVREAERLAHAPQMPVPVRAAADARLSLLADELGRVLGVRAAIRAIGDRRRIVLDCESDEQFAVLLARLVSPDAGGPTRLPPDTATIGAGDAPATPSAVAAGDTRDRSGDTPAAAGHPPFAIETDSRPTSLADVKAWAEASARRDFAEAAGKPLLVTRLLQPECELQLESPAVFHLAPEDALRLEWREERLEPRWQVVPAAPAPQAGVPDAPLWIAAHRYTLAGETQVSDCFSLATDIPPAPPTMPAGQSPDAGDAEHRALLHYQRMLGQLIETSEVCGRHYRWGEERVRLIPPARLRVIETPATDILRWRDGQLQPMWRVMPTLPDPTLDELTDLRMPAPLPESADC